MGWKQLGSPEKEARHVRWAEIGTTVEGEWFGTRDGKMGLLGVAREDNGAFVTFSMTKQLVDRLRDVAEGDVIKVIYRATHQSANGFEWKDFAVYVRNGE